MAYDYDDQNIFARILRGEIPNSTVYETDHTLCFKDINPAAPTHVLAIPKGPYVSYDHFASEASDAEIVDYFRAVGHVCKVTGASQNEGGNGYRIASNAGTDGVQEVPHFHCHILAGRMLGRIAKRAED